MLVTFSDRTEGLLHFYSWQHKIKHYEARTISTSMKTVPGFTKICWIIWQLLKDAFIFMTSCSTVSMKNQYFADLQSDPHMLWSFMLSKGQHSDFLSYPCHLSICVSFNICINCDIKMTTILNTSCHTNFSSLVIYKETVT